MSNLVAAIFKVNMEASVVNGINNHLDIEEQQKGLLSSVLIGHFDWLIFAIINLKKCFISFRGCGQK